MEYNSLLAPDGSEDNMGGTTQRAFVAPLSYFAEGGIKKPVSNPTDLAEMVLIDGEHEFKTAKGFLKLYCTMDKGKLDLKTQGDADGKSFKQEFELFYPGNKEEAHGFAARCKNDSFICLVEMPDTDVDADKGYNQVGTEMFPARISPEFTSGTNSSGVRGYVFKVEAMTNRQYIYKDVVTEMPEGSES